MNDLSISPHLTRDLAHYAMTQTYSDLPQLVRTELVRSFLNWCGCVLGGCQEQAVKIAIEESLEAGGRPQSSIIGYQYKTNMAQAAFINCLSSSILAYDDTHLASVTHPTGPVAAALFAWSQVNPVKGEEFLAALAIGIEIQCRLSKMLVTPPSTFSLGFFITGLTAPIGAAAALARLLKFNEQQMISAIGLATTQASGLRFTHGSMAAAFVPAHAARIGVSAALLAGKGFTCSDHALEGDKGFIKVLAPGAHSCLALDGLGEKFEILANAYKPYPCGIVIHPALDACLDVTARIPKGAKIRTVRLRVHPLALNLTHIRHPRDPLEAQISLFHWVSASLLRGQAGIDEGRQSCIDDPNISRLRDSIEAVADESLARDAASLELVIDTGEIFYSTIAHARGSLARPMTDAELDFKFLAQARMIGDEQKTVILLSALRDLPKTDDVGAFLSSCMDSIY